MADAIRTHAVATPTPSTLGTPCRLGDASKTMMQTRPRQAWPPGAWRHDDASTTTGTSLHQLLQVQPHVIKLHDVPRPCCRRSPRRSKLHQPCKCDCDDTMRRSTPTRRTTQVGMVDIPTMLYRLMDRRGPHADAIHIYTNTMHGDVKRRLKTTTTTA